jgi:AraC family transcriptional regulator
MCPVVGARTKPNYSIAMDEPVIRKEEGFTVAGLGTTFISILSPDANNLDRIPLLWDQFITRIRELSNRADDISWGICLPLAAEERSHDEELKYIAGAAVTSADDLPEGMEAVTIPTATYAIFTHKGRVSDLAKTYGSIYSTWLPSSGYRETSGIELERYDARFTNADDSEMEIWLPVEKATA